MDNRYKVSALIITTIVSAPLAVAADYLSLDAAQKAVYSDATAFEEVFVAQSADQLQQLLARAGQQPSHGTIRIWKATQNGVVLGHVFVDEVIGKQELITYAVGIDTNGALRNLEILSYRESHGGEVRNPAWRSQFNHRRGIDEVRFRTDIKNISGATLSSEHLTEGVRWLMTLWQATLRPPGMTG